ncbi:MAG: dTDP-glucose 4,6-dehydratase [Acidobacteriota bacterium]|nr:dTDP-glucose 4,6-dehydratase [Acidobacteriota bacterium]
MQDCILVTGGAGFIGSNFVLRWLESESAAVVNLDSLTYAGHMANLRPIAEGAAHTFVRGDINDAELVRGLLQQHKPRAIVHFAAESHVDRSIVDPESFIQTNIRGTFRLLEQARRYCDELAPADRERFRFVHISTDEVYGSLGPTDAAFTETTAFAPNSPYAASKAASDHLARAFLHTYGLPVTITNCSNNYGPRQLPEKLIPLVITQLMRGLPLPVYGDGLNVRDWLYVIDHCDAIRLVLRQGRIGETYNVGGKTEKTNLEVVRTICRVFDELRPAGAPNERLIQFVKDRPGHDRRYAIDCSKLQRETGWQPNETFASGVRTTVKWYLDNYHWLQDVTGGEFKEWIKTQYSGALG